MTFAAVTPAHDTKHHRLLSYQISATRTYSLRQDQNSGETGSTLWLSSQILALYLITHVFPLRRHKKRALELGSGIGLGALVLNEFGGYENVTASDQLSILPILTDNLRRNTNDAQKSIEVKVIDWLHDWHGEGKVDEYDTIIMSDVIYAPDLLTGLIDTMSHFSDIKTVIYIAQEIRVPELIETFLEMARKRFKVQRVGELEVQRIIDNLEVQASSDQRLNMQGDQEEVAEVGGRVGEGGGDWSGVIIYKLKMLQVR